MAVDQITEVSTPGKQELWSCFGRWCPGTGSWGCGGLCQGRPGAASCQTRLAPTDPPEGTAGPVSRDGGTSMKTYLRKGRKCWPERGGGNKRSEK